MWVSGEISPTAGVAVAVASSGSRSLIGCTVADPLYAVASMAEAMTALGVLEASPPRFSPAEISRLAADRFGLSGDARDLGSERDQTFLVEGPDGSGIL